MKILFLSEGSHTQDYMRDCVFRGFRELLGPDVVDIHRLDSMYLGADRSSMYGLGMTLYAELPDFPSVDRTDIPRKIATRYFDLVVYGSVHRHHDYLHEVTRIYPPSRVVFLDGEDHTIYLKGLPGHYFKRELHTPHPDIHPIQFSIPASKILPSQPHKSHLMAPMDPLDKSTYIYSIERDYYQQYADSYYAATMRKGGADCLRHYEIMSQWCLPYFRALDAIPTSIMTRLPRPELRLIQESFDYGHLTYGLLVSLYDALISSVMHTLRTHLTTEAMATYILDTVGVSTKETILCS